MQKSASSNSGGDHTAYLLSVEKSSNLGITVVSYWESHKTFVKL